jgi:glycosyltransferase involved in cell wall biosynthesis
MQTPINSMSPFFSIVIPSYNRSVLIQGTLDSVLAQTFADYEVLVVDNCSTDDTAEVVAGYTQRDARIQFYQNDQNYDRSYSRNRGIELSRGQYISLLDSDDFLLPSCLEDAYQFIQKNPDTKVLHFDYEMVDESKKVLSNSKKWPNYPTALQRILVANYIGNIGFFVKNDLLKENLYDATRMLTGSEDWDFWIRLIHHVPDLKSLPKINAQVLQHEGRTMNQFDGEKLNQRTDYIIEKHLAKAQSIHFEKEFLSSCNILIGNGYQESNDVKMAWQFYKKAIGVRFVSVFSYRAMALLKNIIRKGFFLIF